MVKLKDPASKNDQQLIQAASLREARTRPPAPPATPTQDEASKAASEPPCVLHDPLKRDFRVFLTLIWRFLLKDENGNPQDPNPIQLDMAYWLQHGPERSVIMAFRGFSKSWITGAYALWRLYVNPQEKILVISGSLTRAVATTNWCLNLIHAIPELAPLRPRPSQRQSAKAFDVGPALPDQSPSFHALGIGGQIVGFRGDCIIPDDVETQTNSLTPVMRDKIKEAVKEFDSVLKPGGVIKYLGTPHDEDSLYNELVNKRGYTARVWPALFPTEKQIKGYGDKLAPYIVNVLKKGGPKLVGTSTMPKRFTDADLAKRKMSLGNSEFALQFMLDTSLGDRDKYPLKVKDLMVLSLDRRLGPTRVAWSNDPQHRVTDLPAVGFDGDFFHAGVVPEGATLSPWNSVRMSVDVSGRGEDEVAISILAELNGVVFLLRRWSTRHGYEKATLQKIADLCVEYRVQELYHEVNFGDGMFGSLLQPYIVKAWEKANKNLPKNQDPGGTSLIEVKSSNQQAKEKRILAIMEPITQQHRLVVAKEVIEEDQRSVEEYEGTDTRHRYTLFHQYTRLTRERESLYKDDRIDSLAMGCATFAAMLGVDPILIATQAEEDAAEAELRRILGADWDDEEGPPADNRANSFKATPRC